MPLNDNVLPRGDRDPLEELAGDFEHLRKANDAPPAIPRWGKLEQDRSEIEKALAIEEGLRDDEVRFLEDIAKRVIDQGTILEPSQRARLSFILIRHGR